MVPVLSAGHFNLTRHNFTREVRKKQITLVGFSSRGCAKCITVEAEYAVAAAALKELGIAFARVDVEAERYGKAPEINDGCGDYRVSSLTLGRYARCLTL